MVFFLKPTKSPPIKVQWLVKLIQSTKIHLKLASKRKTNLKKMDRKMLQTNMKSHHQFSWVVPESWADKENWWFWLSVTAHALARSEPSWPKKKWLLLHFKWSLKRLLKTLENSVCSQPSQSFLSFLSVLPSKKEFQDNGIQEKTWLKFSTILFWLLQWLSLLFQKVCHWLLLCHWPFQ